MGVSKELFLTALAVSSFGLMFFAWAYLVGKLAVRVEITRALPLITQTIKYVIGGVVTLLILLGFQTIHHRAHNRGRKRDMPDENDADLKHVDHSQRRDGPE